MKVFLERKGRNLAARLLGWMAPVHKVPPGDLAEIIRQTSGAKILFIRPHQGLGDLLLATPVFRALKKAYPSIQIHFLADTYNKVAIRGNPRLDRHWVWDKKGMHNPLRFMAFIRALRSERFTLAIPLSSHVPSFTSYWLARLSGARIVLAYETMPFYGGANWSRHLAHVELTNCPETDPEWVKFMGLVRPLLMTSSDDYSPEFEVGKENEDWAREEWLRLGLSGSAKKKIGVFLGGNPDRPERLWPAASWGDLSVKIQQDPGMLLVAIVPPEDLLSGSRARERGVYGEVSLRLSTPPPVFSNSQLARVAAFLKGLDLFICVDGGLFHIAVASRVRTLGLFFVTDPARWAPPVPWQAVLRPADDKPISLTPDAVYQKIREMVLKSQVATHVE